MEDSQSLDSVVDDPFEYYNSLHDALHRRLFSATDWTAVAAVRYPHPNFASVHALNTKKTVFSVCSFDASPFVVKYLSRTKFGYSELHYTRLFSDGVGSRLDAVSVLDSSYSQNITDEFIEPCVIVDQSNVPIGQITDNDAVIFFNYRPDRARQLTKAFVLNDKDLNNQKTHSGEKVKIFERRKKIENLFFVSLTRYEINLPVTNVAFNPEEVTMPIARIFSERNLKQLHIAETEKYAHVTYFFNGGIEKPFNGEDRILINSPKVGAYDKKPEMSASEVTSKLLQKLDAKRYNFIVLNYANADMVGHSGNIQATTKAVQTIDYQLGIISKAVLSIGGALIITSDHGNAEELINLRTGEVDTQHNLSPVPALLIFNDLRGINVQLPQGLLADIAPTILASLQIPKPSQMTGRSLL